ncbi:ATP-binding protein [Tepidibacillus fermentans]|uniref:ATP-binding protein n=1 Tax=Tepidibacillus fermentans TaxID=1281767 RepID=UPI001A9F25D3|nr:ATP-binding protein [Tepidibacillus fermentans]
MIGVVITPLIDKFENLINKTENKKMYEIARNIQKLSLIGQLSAALVHEIRNPLTSIKGFLQLIESGIIEKNYFDIIHSEFQRIELILSELLVVTRPQVTVFHKQSIQSIIHHVIALMQPQATLHNIELISNLANEPLWIECDENQLKQVFLNLIKNSIEAMPNGGQIRIDVTKASSFTKIRIIDQGCGIPKDIMDKIGQPFFTTKKNGTGLGIMISRKIIEIHKGIMNIQSEEKKGTTITIQLPLYTLNIS